MSTLEIKPVNKTSRESCTRWGHHSGYKRNYFSAFSVLKFAGCRCPCHNIQQEQQLLNRLVYQKDKSIFFSFCRQEITHWIQKAASKWIQYPATPCLAFPVLCLYFFRHLQVVLQDRLPAITWCRGERWAHQRLQRLNSIFLGLAERNSNDVLKGEKAWCCLLLKLKSGRRMGKAGNVIIEPALTIQQK